MIMNVFNHIFIGVVQGIFEWLPISSQGIVMLISQYFIEKQIHPIDIALFLHMGTLFAVLVYFKKDWKNIFIFKDKKLLDFLIIATIPSLIIGFLLFNLVRDVVIGGMLLFLVGFGLLITAFFNRKKYFFKKVSSKKIAIIAGVLQGFSVIPGFSRSAATIFALSLAGFSPEKTLKISYLMSVPVVLAASSYLLLKEPLLFSWGMFLALIFSFLVGLLFLRFLMTFAQKINFFKFCLIFAILCFIGGIIEMF